MPTATLMLKKTYKSKDGTYQLVIRIINGKQQIFYNTGYKVKEDQFKNGHVTKHKDATAINAKVGEKLSQARKYIADCRERRRPIDINLIFSHNHSYSFIDYLKERSEFYREREMVVMRQKADRFVKELKEVAPDIYLDELDNKTLERYDSYLTTQGNSPNTRHKKFEFLGKFFSDAIRDGKTEMKNPFREYKIKTVPVKKEKLTMKELKAIEDLKLRPGSVNDARNLFLLSYYCKGMRFENCVTLNPEKQLRNGRINFIANKSGKPITVLLHSRLRKVLKELDLPFIKDLPTDRAKYISKIGSTNAVVNRNLKDLAELAGITSHLSFHISRHSFAYHLKQKSNNIHIIQDSLGHSRSQTTEVYLKSLDDEILDKELRKLYGR